MTVLTYLKDKATSAVLSESEKSNITTSIDTLARRLGLYFTDASDGLADHFKFGSYTRSTILPRKHDPDSDVDYMIVFAKDGYKPQTYLDRLRRFVEYWYSTSEIYQSSPTVVLELNHIRFDLVPALKAWGDTYYIPKGPNDWQTSSPKEFNASLDRKNAAELYLMKPTIRLAKIWNADNNYVFESFPFEKWMSEQSYLFDTNQKSYLFSVIDKLSVFQPTQWQREKVERAKEIVAKVRQYEREEMPYSALKEVKRLIPE